LIGLAIDVPPFLVNGDAEFELRTLLLRWGVLAVSGVALYVTRPTRPRIRLANKAIGPSQRVSRQRYGSAKRRGSINDTEARSARLDLGRVSKPPTGTTLVHSADAAEP
jgi:hypothetical protein